MAGAPVHRHSPSDIAAFAGTMLAGAWLLTQCYVWFYFAGQAGSPQPDNWNAMRAVLDVIEAGLLPALAMCALGPLAVFAAKKRWLLLAWLHPLVLATFCAGEYALCLDAWANPPGGHVAVRLVPREPARLRGAAAVSLPPGLCWPRGNSPLPMDVGALPLGVGDLARIQSIPDVYIAIARDPAQAARIRSWLGKTVRITGYSRDGGLWFAPLEGPPIADADRFCLRLGDLVRVPTHR